MKSLLGVSVSFVAWLAASSALSETIITWTGSDSFDTQQAIHIPETDAGQLVEIIGPGTYGQVSGVPQTVELSIGSGAAFTAISTSAFGAHGALSAILPAATFQSRFFDRLEITAVGGASELCGVPGACFHDMTGTEFVFARPGEVVWTGDASAPVSETLMFAPIRADGLASIDGSAVFTQATGVPQTPTLEIHLNGRWVTIDTGGFGGSGSLKRLFDPTAFANGIVDGIELTGGSGFVDQYGPAAGYSDLSLESFQFALASAPASAPEPSTWAMMLVGVGLTGSGLRRRARSCRPAGAPLRLATASARRSRP
jgi:hypothetical protein